MYQTPNDNISDGLGLIQQIMEAQEEEGSTRLKKILSSS